MRHFFCDSLKRFFVAFVATLAIVAPTFAANLPSGYTELEYIQGDGNAYIDLGVSLTQDDNIEIEFMSPDSQKQISIFGSRASASSQNILLFYGGTENQIVADFNNSNYASYRLGPLAISANIRYKAVLNKNIRAIYRGDTIVSSNTTVCSDTISISNAYLFFAAGSPSSTGKYAGRIYSVKIAGKRNLVPAKNASGVIGMYDTVSNTFFTNQGTGTFTAGPEVPKYTYLEYIESTGTQYIDTGYKLSSADEVKIKAKYVEFTDQTRSSYLFGIFDSETGFGINSSRSRSFCVWKSTSSTNFTPDITATNVIYDVDLKLGSLTVNGTATDFTPTGTFTNATKTAYLFWANGTSQPKQPVAIYSFQIINNGVLMRDMVPAKNSSGVIGMYDRANNVFYTNQGTGDFIAGPDLVTDGAIKIATTKYTEDAFAGLMTTLSEAITKVTNIVDTTVQQATEIGNLATTKQDRPDTDCPAGRKCLLIMGADNKPHWYLIQE